MCCYGSVLPGTVSEDEQITGSNNKGYCHRKSFFVCLFVLIKMKLIYYIFVNLFKSQDHFIFYFIFLVIIDASHVWEVYESYSYSMSE